MFIFYHTPLYPFYANTGYIYFGVVYTWWPSIGAITGAGELKSGSVGIPEDDPPPVSGDNESSVFVVKLFGEISPYPERAEGVSPPPNGPNGGLLLKVVLD